MKVVIAGASGLIGTKLTAELQRRGHEVIRLVRQRNRDGIYWNPESGEIDSEKLSGVTCAINLAGENIAAGRWSEAQKSKILDSRVNGTRVLVQALQKSAPGANLLNASAIGIYGDRGQEFLTEESRPGDSFLSQVCMKWEQEAQKAASSGINVQLARIGIVLSPEGGALGKMLLPFKLGLGGPLGDGKQYMSWIDIDDVVSALAFLAEHPNLNGPFNLVSPNPVTNAEFTKDLGSVLKRPAFLPAPPFALKAALGEMADELLLGGAKVSSSKLTSAGFKFAYPNLVDSLEHLLNGRVAVSSTSESAARK